VGKTSVTVGVLLDPVLVDDEGNVVLVVAFAATVVLGELPFLSLPQLATDRPTQHTAATTDVKRTVPSFHPGRDRLGHRWETTAERPQGSGARSRPR
jgi:hypothetical protein